MWTGTFGPVARMRLAAACQSATDDVARAKLLVKAGGVYATRWLKRLRKSGVVVRYLMVPERHKDGMLHWHALLHTQANKRAIGGRWSVGFERVKLVTDPVRGARYVTKYLAKERLGRIRASRGYGVLRPAAIASGGEREGSLRDLNASVTDSGLSETGWLAQLDAQLQSLGYPPLAHWEIASGVVTEAELRKLLLA